MILCTVSEYFVTLEYFLVGNTLIEHHSEGASEFKQKLTALCNEWMDLYNMVNNKHKLLQDASHQYGEFRSMLLYLCVNRCIITLLIYIFKKGIVIVLKCDFFILIFF